MHVFTAYMSVYTYMVLLFRLCFECSSCSEARGRFAIFAGAKKSRPTAFKPVEGQEALTGKDNRKNWTWAKAFCAVESRRACCSRHSFYVYPLSAIFLFTFVCVREGFSWVHFPKHHCRRVGCWVAEHVLVPQGECPVHSGCATCGASSFLYM